MVMRRHRSSNDNNAGGDDSFLDVVANIVGILIILVLVAGVRAGRSGAPTENITQNTKSREELLELQRVANSLQRDVLELASQQQQVAIQAKLTRSERDQLAFLEADMHSELEQRRQSLSARQRAEIETRKQKQAADEELKRLHDDIERLSKAPKNVIKIETLPTPISHTVDGSEEHFQLRADRITYVPLDELLARLKSDAQRQISKLRGTREVTSVVGPVGGFRMRYTLERVDISPREQLATGRGGSFARLVEWNLVPVSNRLEETLEEALGPNSDFRAVVARLNPHRTTITLWTYPDSFAQYRRIRRELFDLGFQTAGRPLPHDVPIGGSPDGTKSAGQ